MGSDPATLVANTVTATTNLSVWESMIQILPGDLTEMRRRSFQTVSTSDVVFVEEPSLRVLAVRLQIVDVNITCQTLR